MNYLRYFTLIFLSVFISEALQANKRAVTRGQSSKSNSRQQGAKPQEVLARFTPRNLNEDTRPVTDFSTPSHVTTINHSSFLNKIFNPGYALIDAVIKGDIEKAKSLIDRGADVNVQDNFIRPALVGFYGRRTHWTPLMHAAAMGDLEMVRFLVEKGADVNKTGPNNITPLMVVNSSNLFDKLVLAHVLAYDDVLIDEITLDQDKEDIEENIEVVRFLLESGADISAVNEFGYTAYFYAMDKGHLDSIRLLMQSDPNSNPIIQFQTIDNPNHFNPIRLQGASLFTLASYQGNLELIKLLVNEMGIDVNVRDQNNWTALMAARFSDHSEIAEFLENKGAKLNLEDFNILVAANLPKDLRDKISIT